MLFPLAYQVQLIDLFLQNLNSNKTKMLAEKKIRQIGREREGEREKERRREGERVREREKAERET